MSRLRMLQVLIATVFLSAGLAVVPIMAAGTAQTFTGKVSDAMCGAKHTRGLPPQPVFMHACRRAPSTPWLSMTRSIPLTLRIKRR